MHFTDGKLQNWNVDDLRKNLLQRDIQIGNNAPQANLIQKVNSAQKLDLPIQHSQDEGEKEILNAKHNKLSIDGVQIHHPNGRDGFRGGDLVTCHPLFTDMTLQSQILVIESLFLTSVSKFIRKYLLSRQFSYMYSSCCNPATSLVKFSDNSFEQ